MQGEVIVVESANNVEEARDVNRVTRDGFAAMAILAITVVLIVFVVVQLV